MKWTVFLAAMALGGGVAISSAAAQFRYYSRVPGNGFYSGGFGPYYGHSFGYGPRRYYGPPPGVGPFRNYRGFDFDDDDGFRPRRRYHRDDDDD